MGVLEKSNGLLKESLLKNNKPFNYKLLSRKLDVHVNDAKKLLYSFYVKHQELLQATYIITGQIRGSSGLSIKVTVDLDEKDRFDRIDSVQVYSLSPLNVQVEEIITTLNQEIREIEVTEEKLSKWGVIKGPALVTQETVPARQEPIEQAPSTSTAAPSRSSTVQSRSNTAAPPAAPAPKKKPDSDMKSLSMVERFRQRQQDAKKESQPTIGRSLSKDQPKPKHDTSLSSSRRSQTEPSRPSAPAAEVIEEPDLDDAEYIKKQKAEKEAKLKKQKELESMFDDDDDDLMESPSESVQEEPKKIEEPKKSVPQNAESPSKKPKMDDLEDIFNSSISQSQKTQETLPKSSPTKESTKEESKEGVSTYVDEDGYIVTKRELPAKVKPKAKARPSSQSSSSGPATKKAKAAAGGVGKQSSLLNFFGKK